MGFFEMSQQILFIIEIAQLKDDSESKREHLGDIYFR